MTPGQRRMKALATEIIEHGFRVHLCIPKSRPIGADEKRRRTEQLREALRWPGEKTHESAPNVELSGPRGLHRSSHES